MRLALASLVVFVVVAVARCATPPQAEAPDAGRTVDAGSEDGGGDAGADPLAELERRYVDATCAMFVRCGNVPSAELCDVALNPYGSTFDGPLAIWDSIRAGKILFHEERFAACLAALADECPTQLDGFVIKPHACDLAFEGLVGAMNACISSEACPPGGICYIASASEPICAGGCFVPPPGTCLRDAECVEGEVCGAGNECVQARAPGGEGEPCGAKGECRDGLVCRSEVDDATGSPVTTCVPPAREGESCPQPECAEGLECLANESGEGASCVRVPAIGTACSTDAACQAFGALLWCDEGRCAAYPTSGACRKYDGRDACAPGHFCERVGAVKTCRPLRSRGEACSAAGECAFPLECRAEADDTKRCLLPPAPHRCVP